MEEGATAAILEPRVKEGRPGPTENPSPGSSMRQLGTGDRPVGGREEERQARGELRPRLVSLLGAANCIRN